MALLRDPSGSMVLVPDEQVASALQQGYAQPSAEEAAGVDRQNKYGGTGNALLTGLESAGSAATFGGSTWLEKLAGVDPEGIKAREEVHPVASGLGTAIGVLAPALLTDGGSLALEGAEGGAAAARLAQAGGAAEGGLSRLIPTNMLSRFGQKAGRATEKALADQFGAPVTVGGRILRKTAGAAAGSAIEGAFYGAGQDVHESALGDPNFTGETAFATVAGSALLGGIFGGALGAGGSALSELAGSAGPKALTERMAGWLGPEGVLDLNKYAAVRGIKAAGGIQSDMRQMIERYGGTPERVFENVDLARKPEYGILDGLFQSKESVLRKAEALQDSAGERIGQIVKDADAASVPANKTISAADAASGRSTPRFSRGKEGPDIDDFVREARERSLSALADNPLRSATMEKVNEELEKYAEKFKGGMTFQDLHKVEEQLRVEAFGNMSQKTPKTTALGEAFNDLRRLASQQLDDGIKRVGADSAAWKLANRQYEVGSMMEQFAKKGVLRQMGNNQIPLSAMLGLFAGHIAGGPLGGLALGAGTYAAREFGSSISGGLAAALRDRLAGSAAEEAAPLAGRVASVLKDEPPPAAGGAPVPPSTPPTPPAPPPVSQAGPVVSSERPPVSRAPVARGSRETVVVTPQRPRGEPARYELVEAGDLVASHNPQTFAPRADYPPNVQERDYRVLENEQRKVEKGGRQLDPRFLLSDTPSAVDGPPLVTTGSRPVVLGGNGRTMMMQRAFTDAAVRDAYRSALLERAPSFGIAPAEVEAMKSPVLVRVMMDVPSGSTTKALSGAVRRFNEGMTQQLSARALAVSESRLLSDSSVNAIGELLTNAGDGSLRDVMRDRPKELVEILTRDGIVNSENRQKFVTTAGLTEEGKDRIEGMFLGRVLGTGARISATAPALLQKIERAVPSLLRTSAVNGELDLIPELRVAVDLLNEAKQRGGSLADLLKQVVSGKMLGEADLPRGGQSLALAELLERANQRSIGTRFRRWASHAAVDPNQGSMFGAKPTQQSAQGLLFGELGADEATPVAAAASRAPSAPAAKPSVNLGWDSRWHPEGLPEDPAAAPPPTEPSTQPETVTALAALERNNTKATDQIALIAKHLIGKGPAIGGAIEALGAKAIREQMERINSLANNPALLQHVVATQTEHMTDSAPASSQAYAAAFTRAVLHLQATMPAGRPATMLSPAGPPSGIDAASWSRRVATVKDPLKVLSSGHISQEVLDTIGVVYPTIYAQLRSAVTAELADVAQNGTVPHEARPRLARIAGLDLNGDEATLGANQLTFQAPPGHGGGAPSRPRKPTAASKSFGRQYETEIGRIGRGQLGSKG